MSVEEEVAALGGHWRVEWEERAAIREYCGKQSRKDAEAGALEDIKKRMAKVAGWKAKGVDGGGR